MAKLLVLCTSNPLIDLLLAVARSTEGGYENSRVHLCVNDPLIAPTLLWSRNSREAVSKASEFISVLVSMTCYDL